MNRAKDARSATGVDRADALLKARVEAALQLDRDRSLRGLKVKGVNHGAIQMDATGVTMTGRLRAIQLAWDVAEEAQRLEHGSSPAPESTKGDKGETP